MAQNDRAAVLERALEACVLGKVDALPELFAPDVSAWSPNLLVSSLDELTETVGQREDALSDVNIDVGALDIVGNKGYMEYRLSATFSGPLVVDDDTVIEPHGQRDHDRGRAGGRVHGGQGLRLPQLLRRRSPVEQILLG